MKEQTRLALGALSGLSFYPKQEAELDEAAEYDSRAFERLVAYAATAENPAGSLVSGARKIVSEGRALEAVRGNMDGERAAKRVHAALNYSASALGCVPLVDQEEHLRSEFPWIAQQTLQECLAIGYSAWQAQEADQLEMIREAQARRAYREAKK